MDENQTTADHLEDSNIESYLLSPERQELRKTGQYNWFIWNRENQARWNARMSDSNQ
jgi:hypothetical protein